MRSDGIVLDATAPVINGADNGKTYCGSVTLTFTDDNRVTVKLNGNPVTLTNGKLTIAPATGEQTVSATDEAGNCTTIKVTVNGSHTWGDWTSNGNNTHSRTCAVDGAHTETADCHGGNATCKTKAICDDCRAPYGSYGVHYWDTSTWGYKGADGHAHTCKTDGCTAHSTLIAHIKSRDEATENDPVICAECGYVIAEKLDHICANHLTPVEAKAATCTETGNKAYYVCSCGKLYADATASVEITEAQTVLAVHDHDYEWKIDKEATADENGSKHEECKLCHDKKAAVVIPAIGKTDSGTDKTSPKTGESNMVGLWVALLFVSGAGVAGATVYKKRKRSVK